VKTLPPITDLVPHRGGMLLIDELLHDDLDQVRACVTVRRDQLFVTDEGMPAWVGVELMAQTVAAWGGMRRRDAGQQVQLGFLLGTRKYETRVPFFPIGQRVEISARLEMVSEAGLGVFISTIEVGGKAVATASLNVFQPPNVEAYLREFNA
jgi:predicted hotdog family 3-hydroxylacyl-ACP dehydratase